MKNIIFLILVPFTVFILIPENAIADPSLCTASETNCCTTTTCKGVLITRFYVEPSGRLNIATTGVEADLANTCNGSNGYIRLRKDSGHYDQSYSLLLSAHINQLPITINAQNDSSDGRCKVGYVISDK